MVFTFSCMVSEYATSVVNGVRSVVGLDVIGLLLYGVCMVIDQWCSNCVCSVVDFNSIFMVLAYCCFFFSVFVCI